MRIGQALNATLKMPDLIETTIFESRHIKSIQWIWFGSKWLLLLGVAMDMSSLVKSSKKIMKMDSNYKQT